MSLATGTLGLYFGIISRKRLKESTKNILMIDIFTSFLVFYFTFNTINFWFIQGRFDATTLEILWIVVDVYFDVGLACFMYIFVLVIDVMKKRRKEHDANGEVQASDIE